MPIVIFTIMMMSCFSSRDYIVESDYSYSGKFKKYKTYMFISMQNSGIDTHVIDDMLKNAINYRMSLLGYQEVRENPDLLVTYKLYFDDFEFKGFNQPELEVWIKNKRIIEDNIANHQLYRLKKGTLFIQLIDKKRYKTIWQGYNSGLLNTKSLDNGRYVKFTVRTIMEKYRIFAFGSEEI